MLATATVAAQVAKRPAGIEGYVQNVQGESLPGISIIINSTQVGTATDSDGYFQIATDTPGLYQLDFSGIGYAPVQQEVRIRPSETIRLYVTLQDHTLQLEEVTITAKSDAAILRESGLSVQVIETQKIKNLPADLNRVMKILPGNNIRESGGRNRTQRRCLLQFRLPFL